MIVTMTGEYTICEDNEISDWKIFIIPTLITLSNDTRLMRPWNITISKHIVFYVNPETSEQDTILGYQE